MTQIVIKKNQQTENFSRLKLIKSIQAALEKSGQSTETSAKVDQLVEAIESYLNIFFLSQNNVLTTDILRALTVKALNENQLSKTAETYQNFKKNPANSSDIFNKTEITAINEHYLSKISGQNNRGLAEFRQLVKNLEEEFSFPFLEHFEKRRLIFPAVLGKKHLYDQNQIVLQDDLGNIFNALKDLAINHQNQISTTLDFSKIRPKNSLIESTQGRSAGPVSFMKIFISSLDALDQNKTSFPEQMHQIVLSIDHPDILEYLILIKNQSANPGRFNFQIRLSRHFLESLFKAADFELVNPINREISNILSSSNLFDLLVSTMQENYFCSLIRETDTALENIQFLNFQLNLASFVVDHQFDNLGFENLLTQLESIPLRNSRLKINLQGLASLFGKLSLSYFSVQTLEFVSALTEILANHKQLSFGCHKSIFAENIFQTTTGIEPNNELVHIKWTVDGSEKIEILPTLEKLLIAKRLLQEPLLRLIGEYNSVAPLSELTESEKNLFQTNQDLTPIYQLQIKQIFEEKLNSSFPKIVSFPKNFSHEEIKELLISNLKNNLQSLSLLHFEENEDKNLENSYQDQKNFLLSLHHKKRKAKQVQPPLFQIKKTEEVFLPPIQN